MSSALSTSQGAAPTPQNMYLLVQEIVDEENYSVLTKNVQSLHTLCVGGTDKVRLIFSAEPPAKVSEKVFKGVNQRSKATLVLLSSAGLSPASVLSGATASTTVRA